MIFYRVEDNLIGESEWNEIMDSLEQLLNKLSTEYGLSDVYAN
jgi:hypothetical protein